MNRCNPHSSTFGNLLTPLLLLLSSMVLVPHRLASAQGLAQNQPQRIPPISIGARPGVLHITTPPEALLDGKPARLAPGARIRDRNNLLVVSGALIGQDLTVRYTLDMLGLVHEVWVLTAAEAAALKPPAPVLPAY